MSEIIGVDIGGTRIRASNGAGQETVFATSPPALADVPDAVAALVSELDADPAGIGVGCAGLVDHAAGVVRWSPHLAGMDLPLGDALEQRFGVPVWVDNDANAAVLAEARTGAGVGHRVVLMITVGTGLGAGLTVDGRLERGRGHLGEVGHMRVGDLGECACGRVGCWELHASGSALDRAAREVGGPDGPWLIDRARAGDAAAREAVDRVASALAVGIGNLVLVLDPDVVVLGGIIPSVGALLHEPTVRHLAVQGGGLDVIGLPPVVVAAHGERAGLEGAIIGAMEIQP